MVEPVAEREGLTEGQSVGDCEPESVREGELVALALGQRDTLPERVGARPLGEGEEDSEADLLPERVGEAEGQAEAERLALPQAEELLVPLGERAPEGDSVPQALPLPLPPAGLREALKVAVTACVSVSVTDMVGETAPLALGGSVREAAGEALVLRTALGELLGAGLRLVLCVRLVVSEAVGGAEALRDTVPQRDWLGEALKEGLPETEGEGTRLAVAAALAVEVTHQLREGEMEVLARGEALAGGLRLGEGEAGGVREVVVEALSVRVPAGERETEGEAESEALLGVGARLGESVSERVGEPVLLAQALSEGEREALALRVPGCTVKVREGEVVRVTPAPSEGVARSLTVAERERVSDTVEVEVREGEEEREGERLGTREGVPPPPAAPLLAE